MKYILIAFLFVSCGTSLTKGKVLDKWVERTDTTSDAKVYVIKEEFNVTVSRGDSTEHVIEDFQLTKADYDSVKKGDSISFRVQ